MDIYKIKSVFLESLHGNTSVLTPSVLNYTLCFRGEFEFAFVRVTSDLRREEIRDKVRLLSGVILRAEEAGSKATFEYVIMTVRTRLETSRGHLFQLNLTPLLSGQLGQR